MASAPTAPALPRLMGNDPISVRRWADALVQALERQLLLLKVASGDSAYTLSNVTASRSLDPTTASLAETAQVLATTIQDLQKGGRLA